MAWAPSTAHPALDRLFVAHAGGMMPVHPGEIPMTLHKLTAEFQPCATDGALGLETITHSGESITLDLTAYVIGMTPEGVRGLHAEASKFPGKDLDHVADAVPGLVENNTGTGGYDMILDGDDIEDFFRLHGLEVADLTQSDLATLREEYGTEPGAAPTMAGEAPPAPGPR
jgi:hypothetical protein